MILTVGAALALNVGPWPFAVLVGPLLIVTLLREAVQPLAISVGPPLAPPRLLRWLDIWAAKDPVPNGPTMTVFDGWPDSRPVRNDGSFLRSHTGYTHNKEECIELVVLELLAAASGDQAPILRGINLDLRERTWRRFLRTVGSLVVGASFVSFALKTMPRDGVGARDFLCKAIVCESDQSGDTATKAEIVSEVERGDGWIRVPFNPLDLEGAWAVALVGGMYVVLGAGALGIVRLAWRNWSRWEELRSPDSQGSMETYASASFVFVVLAVATLGFVGKSPVDSTGVELVRDVLTGLSLLAVLTIGGARAYLSPAHNWFVGRPQHPRPISVAAMRRHVHFLIGHFRHEEAAGFVEPLAEMLATDDAALLDLRARLAHLSGRPDDAERLFLQAMELDEHSMEWRANYAAFLLAESRDQEARAEYERVRAAGNGSAELSLELAFVDALCATEDAVYSEALDAVAKHMRTPPGRSGTRIVGMDFTPLLVRDWATSRSDADRELLMELVTNPGSDPDLVSSLRRGMDP